MDLPSFDVMMQMAKNNPEQLEELRLALVEDTITKAPVAYQRRLRGLQFQIDMERRLAGNPMGACINISKMMHDSLYTLRQALNSATGEPTDLEFNETKTNTPSAQVFNFPMQANS
ncbi:MAG: DUF3135 domain-containing protein [Oleibacter sp.]|nr:DUF3135 domain-containing protein [Thalassolituus sp.]